MSVAKTHRNISRWAHNRIWDDRDQTLCSRAYYRSYIDWRWKVFRVAMDIAFWLYERRHCRRSFDRYW